MGKPPDEHLTQAISQEICERAGGKAVLAGSISQVGGRYNLILNAINCVTGDTFATTHAGASTKDAVLDSLGKVGSEIRGKLGESLGSIQKFNTPVSSRHHSVARSPHAPTAWAFKPATPAATPNRFPSLSRPSRSTLASP